VGVEKGEGRKVGLEELVFADGRDKVTLPRLGGTDAVCANPRRGPPLCHHRHARQARQGAHGRQQARRHPWHRAPKSAPSCCSALAGVRGVASASVDDLLGVEGISRELAETIYNALH
jgi:excinuclease ABC subunit C